MGAVSQSMEAQKIIFMDTGVTVVDTTINLKYIIQVRSEHK